MREQTSDPLRLTLAEERELMHRVQGQIRHWRGRVDPNDYADMLGESYLKAWQSYRHGVATGVAVPLDYALHYAAMGPANWLHAWYGKANARGLQVEAAGEDTADWPDPRPGPEAEALRRLELRSVWDWLRRVITPAQLEVLASFYVAGLNGEETAARLGVNPNAVWQRHDRGIAAGQTDPAHLMTFLPLATDYPRCRRGHYLTPENVGRGAWGGRLQRYCLVCKRPRTKLSHRKLRAAARAKAQQGQQTAPGGQQMRSGPELDLGHPSPKNGVSPPP